MSSVRAIGTGTDATGTDIATGTEIATGTDIAIGVAIAIAGTPGVTADASLSRRLPIHRRELRT